MSIDYDLIAKNSNLAEMTEEFRNSLKEFVERSREQMSVMNNAFAKNGLSGEDDLVSSSKDVLLNNIREISANLDRLSALDERLSKKQDDYEKLIADLWNGMQS